MSFANFIRENSSRIHQVEGQLEMAKDWNCFWKFVIFENFSTWAGRPWELGHLKNLCVSLPLSNGPLSLRSSFFKALSSPYLLSSAPSSLISFKCAFECLIIIFRVLSSPYLLSSAPSSLISFKCAFEPSIIIFSTPSSPHLLSSAPLSPWPSKVVRFLTLPLFRVRLRALTSFEHAFELSLPVECNFEPSLFLECAFEPSLYFKRAFEPSLPFERAFEPSTILLSAPSSPHFPFSFYLGRSPITMRPFLFLFLLG